MRERASWWLPGGLALSPAEWAVRHRWVTVVLAVHLPLLAAWAVSRGTGPRQLAVLAVPAAALLAARLDVVTGRRVVPSPQLASCSATFGLMACSSFLVSVSGGYVEAHFHFFVMIPVIALYEAWAPFGVGVAVVLLEHGLVGTVWPHAVFGHASMQMDHPWRFAVVHAAFVAAASVASLVTWRVAEGVRRDERDLLEQLRHRTRHDELTGLANRTGLAESMSGVLADAEARAAVVVLDLDRFKQVNDTLGHSAGDDLLRQVADRMRQTVGAGGVLARLGGDEFAVLLPDTSLEGGVATARRLVATVSRGLVVAGVAVSVGASAGVTAGGGGSEPGEATPGEALLRQADVAMYDAKVERGGVAVYDRATDEDAVERLTLLNDLREALEAGTQLVVHLQPKIALDDERLVGVEALARWFHPTRGLIPPSDFVPLVSGTDLSEQFTTRVLDLSLATCAQWSRTGHRVPISVNVSPTCLLRPVFVPAVVAGLRRHGVSPDLLCLELTEDALVADPTATTAVLDELRAIGVRCSVDDFGTGFSSLSYLRRLPLDELKVDRSFVTGLGTEGPDGADEVLLSTIIDLGHRLGLTVVAEGVETTEESRVLRRLGCDTVQGFLYSRAVPAELFPQSMLDTARVGPALVDTAVPRTESAAADGTRMAAAEA